MIVLDEMVVSPVVVVAVVVGMVDPGRRLFEREGAGAVDLGVFGNLGAFVVGEGGVLELHGG